MEEEKPTKEKTEVVAEAAAKVEQTPVTEAVPAVAEEVVVVPVEEKKDERTGIVYIFSSQNNTILHLTDMAGNTLLRVSGGMVTKHSRLKADPTIAMFAAKKICERAKDLGITSFYVRTRAKTGGMGIGSGAHAAVKSISKEGYRIINILDTTRVARGGPKKKGGKRGRRV